ncbi:MAG: class I SAM-dependent methyltransferase [Actinomycetota bacterium]|nr:class I SAM-dependent methyltransferase [Actinomycetota bacterium]
MSLEERLAKPLSPLREALVFGRSIGVDVAHKAIFRRSRTKQKVTSDYDQGEWADLLRDRKWERSGSLEEYLIPDVRGRIKVLIDQRVHEVDAEAYYALRSRKLVDILSANDGGASELIEIGCGAGRNLFTLAAHGRWQHIHGFDISPTGLAVIGEVAARFNLTNVSASSIDLLEESYCDHPRLKGSTVFSYYCLEQLPAHAERVIRRLVAAGVRRGLHIEPSLELFSPWRLQDIATVSYIWRQDYQRSLVTAVRSLEKEGLLRMVKAERLGYAPSVRNEPTLVVWEAV